MGAGKSAKMEGSLAMVIKMRPLTFHHRVGHTHSPTIHGLPTFAVDLLRQLLLELEPLMLPSHVESLIKQDSSLRLRMVCCLVRGFDCRRYYGWISFRVQQPGHRFRCRVCVSNAQLQELFH